MKAIIMVMALMASASVVGGVNDSIELVKNTQIVSIQSAHGGNGRSFFLTLKGGTGKCANQKVEVFFETAHSISLYTRNYDTALTAFSMQLKTVSLGGMVGKEDCDQITYIKLTHSSD